MHFPLLLCSQNPSSVYQPRCYNSPVAGTTVSFTHKLVLSVNSFHIIYSITFILLFITHPQTSEVEMTVPYELKWLQLCNNSAFMLHRIWNWNGKWKIQPMFVWFRVRKPKQRSTLWRPFNLIPLKETATCITVSTVVFLRIEQMYKIYCVFDIFCTCICF